MADLASTAFDPETYKKMEFQRLRQNREAVQSVFLRLCRDWPKGIKRMSLDYCLRVHDEWPLRQVADWSSLPME